MKGETLIKVNSKRTKMNYNNAIFHAFLLIENIFFTHFWNQIVKNFKKSVFDSNGPKMESFTCCVM